MQCIYNKHWGTGAIAGSEHLLRSKYNLYPVLPVLCQCRLNDRNSSQISGRGSLNRIWCDECNIYTMCIRELVQQHLRNTFTGQNKSFDPVQIGFVWENQ